MYLVRTTCGLELAHETEAMAELLARTHVAHCVEAIRTNSYCTADVYAPGEERIMELEAKLERIRVIAETPDPYDRDGEANALFQILDVLDG